MRSAFNWIVVLTITTFSAVSAQDVLVGFGDSWKYYDNGNEPSGSWEDIGYNDASWSSGNAELGYGDGDETTVISSSAITGYFRHTFTVADASAYGSIDLDLIYDDGAVVYLNGTEVWRVNMPSGSVSYGTFSAGEAPDNSNITTNIANSLVTGTNVFAVEMHQRSSSSSDISFNFEATAQAGSSNTLAQFGDTWKYYDNGNEPSGSWESIGYNDASWASGPSQLGFGDGDEATAVTSGVYAAYFRKSFNVTDPAAFQDIDIDLLYDDGAIVYLNGSEVYRINVDANPAYGDFANSVSSENATTSATIANTLVTGTNVWAVEIHNESSGSSDISFNFAATANEATAPGADLINFGATWKYLDDGSNQGTAWRNNGFNDAGWSSGPAELGYGDGGEATVVNSGPSQDKYITTYFRHEFNVTTFDPADFLELSTVRDDGAVVYLNGTEVWRDNLPSGSIDYLTTANGAIAGGDESTPVIALVSASLLQTGSNVIAVEIHQTSGTSSDISFDLKLENVGSQSANLLRGPYLQLGTPTSVVVRWRTNVPTTSVVEYGTSLGNLNMTAEDLSTTTEHELTISGLSPNTKYYYRVLSGSNVLVAEAADVYFQTSPTAGTQQPITAWVLGDCGTADANQRNVRDAYYNYIGPNHTDMILFLGDNAYNDGYDSEYQNAVFENMYEHKLKNTVSWSTLGNHDGYQADAATQSGPYFDIFTFPTAGEAGGVASGTEAYYSFDYGNIHFIVLESYETDRSVGGTMYNWAQSDIQNTTQDWIVAFWHHPPYTKGSHNSDTETELIQMRENFLPMLEDNGVDLVLAGHSHSYERTYFIEGHYGNSGTFNINTMTVGATGDGDGKTDGNGAYVKEITGPEANDGTVYITAGSSGKVTGTLTQHNAMYEYLYQRGSVVLEVDGGNMDVKFVHESGSVNDYFTIDKNLSNPLEASIQSSSDVSCGGIDDGTATAAASGGTGSYSYTWSHGPTSVTVAGLNPGSYWVEVDDGVELDTAYVTIIDPNNTYYQDSDSDGFGDAASTTRACSAPGGYVSDNTDCDDSNNTVYPGATEICDGLDNNCDGNTDEGVLNTYYLDSDLDGYGDAANSTQACSAPGGYVADNTDCDDSNNAVNPGATEICDGIDNNCDGNTDEGVLNTYYLDSDADGYGDAANSTQACSAPGGYVADNTDCDDSNNAVNPGTTEICDGIDNNCDGNTDEGVLNTYYLDSDSDGYGDVANSTQACSVPGGYVADNTDCDDSNNAVNPGVTEICDGIDNNCDGNTDEGLLTTYYLDSDSDGYGDAANSVQACSAPGGYVTDNTDCDDTDNAINPGATELCDGIDNNCDGNIDEGLTLNTYYLDADSDSYGDAGSSIQACTPPAGYVSDNTDCDDGDNAINPGAAEVCDGVDNNCDGNTDEGLTQFTYYLDSDADGFGDTANSVQDCSQPAGYVSDNSDCDDSNTAIYPGATEVCDGMDNNCDGNTDEGVLNTYYLDADSDGFGDNANSTLACAAPGGYVTDNTDCDDGDNTVYPGAAEICDGLDNNCDGNTDEGVLNTYYLDSDSDGYGDAANSTQACSAPGGYVSNNTDCDDSNNAVNPGAAEICDGLDNNCDGNTDEGVLNTYYLDSDSDGYGDAANSTQACSAPGGYVSNNTDCDDSNNAVNPGATEICDGIDNNCDGNTDEGLLTTYYLDSDSDGYGDAGNSTQACSAPGGYVTDNTDCDDSDNAVNPGTAEVCDDGIDNNCDGNIDEGCISCSYQTINFNNFESGWGIWNDGGSDARRSRRDASYALGTYAIRLRDNSSTSVMTTDNLNLTAYDEVTIDFSYYARSMDNSNEDFWLQISTNGGSSYTPVEEWNRDDEFVNNARYYDNVVISGPFTTNTRFRFRCDASGNKDWVYIDEVDITGCYNGGGSRADEESVEPVVAEETATIDLPIQDKLEFDLFPVPTRNELNIRFLSEVGDVELIRITDIKGSVVMELNDPQTQTVQMDVSRLKAGIYMVSALNAEDKTFVTKRFIVLD